MIVHSGKMVRPAIFNFDTLPYPESNNGWCWVGDIATIVVGCTPSEVVERYGPLNKYGFDRQILITNTLSHWLPSLSDAIALFKRHEGRGLPEFGAVKYFVSAGWVSDILDIHTYIHHVDLVVAKVEPKDMPKKEIGFKSDPLVQKLSERLGGVLLDYRHAPSGTPHSYVFQVGRKK
jgi:hypothetical protein